jgi:hypothetical protein
LGEAGEGGKIISIFLAGWEKRVNLDAPKEEKDVL